MNIRTGSTKYFWTPLLLCILIALFVADVFLGSVYISPRQIIKTLTGTGAVSDNISNIIFLLRLPKAFTAVLAGVALSISGLLLQTLFRNPLAGPSVLGITSGASLGVAAVLLGMGSTTGIYIIRELGVGQSLLIFTASSVGAFGVLMIILFIARKVQDNVIILIIGIMVGNITISIISIWQYFSSPEQIQDFLFWTFGSLGGVTNENIILFAVPVILLVAAALLISHPLNVFLIGESNARSLGIDIRRVRMHIIVISSMLTGIVTGFCGPIGFIGIAVPHLARSIFNTTDHKVLVPACAVMGAITLLVSDIISRLPGSQFVLPINAITAMIGSPVVIWIITRRRNLKGAF